MLCNRSGWPLVVGKGWLLMAAPTVDAVAISARLVDKDGRHSMATVRSTPVSDLIAISCNHKSDTVLTGQNIWLHPSSMSPCWHIAPSDHTSDVAVIISSYHHCHLRRHRHHRTATDLIFYLDGSSHVAWLLPLYCNDCSCQPPPPPPIRLPPL